MYTFDRLLCGRQRSQFLGGKLGSDITLWRAEHFESNHELSHSRRAQQRRIEVRVEVPLWMLCVIGRSLMESHRVREGNIENAVIGGNDLFQNRTQFGDLAGTHVRKAREMSAAAKEH